VFVAIETSRKDQDDYVRAFDEQINTAVSSTQIVDEFFVHHTKDIKATVELIRMLHEGVCERYRVTVIVLSNMYDTDTL
jgi:ERCC4-type nuclease